MPEPIRLATIGTSMISDDLLDAAAQVDSINYVGTYSRNPITAREFTEHHGGTRPFTTLEQLANCKDVDAVYIASPNALHFDQALACIRRDKHVLIEKRPAPTVSRRSPFMPRRSSTTSSRSKRCAPSTIPPGPRSSAPSRSSAPFAARPSASASTPRAMTT